MVSLEDYQFLQSLKGKRLKLRTRDEAFIGVIQRIVDKTIVLEDVKAFKSGREHTVRQFHGREILGVEFLRSTDDKIGINSEATITEGHLTVAEYQPYRRDILPDKDDEEEYVNYVVINEFNQNFLPAIMEIQQAKAIGIAADGIGGMHLERLCWLQIAKKHKVFLFDILALGSLAFKNGLTKILTSERILKVTHDGRRLAACLMALYGVKLMRVFDTQVADFLLFYRHTGGLLPDRVCTMQEVVTLHLGMPASHQSSLNIKSQLSKEDREVWYIRPCPEPLLKLMALSVIHLLPLREVMLDALMSDFTSLVDSYMDSVLNEPVQTKDIGQKSGLELSHVLCELEQLQQERQAWALDYYPSTSQGRLVRFITRSGSSTSSHSRASLDSNPAAASPTKAPRGSTPPSGSPTPTPSSYTNSPTHTLSTNSPTAHTPTTPASTAHSPPGDSLTAHMPTAHTPTANTPTTNMSVPTVDATPTYATPIHTSTIEMPPGNPPTPLTPTSYIATSYIPTAYIPTSPTPAAHMVTVDAPSAYAIPAHASTIETPPGNLPTPLTPTAYILTPYTPTPPTPNTHMLTVDATPTHTSTIETSPVNLPTSYIPTAHTPTAYTPTTNMALSTVDARPTYATPVHAYAIEMPPGNPPTTLTPTAYIPTAYIPTSPTPTAHMVTVDAPSAYAIPAHTSPIHASLGNLPTADMPTVYMATAYTPTPPTPTAPMPTVDATWAYGIHASPGNLPTAHTPTAFMPMDNTPTAYMLSTPMSTVDAPPTYAAATHAAPGNLPAAHMPTAYTPTSQMPTALARTTPMRTVDVPPTYATPTHPTAAHTSTADAPTAPVPALTGPGSNDIPSPYATYHTLPTCQASSTLALNPILPATPPCPSNPSHAIRSPAFPQSILSMTPRALAVESTKNEALSNTVPKRLASPKQCPQSTECLSAPGQLLEVVRDTMAQSMAPAAQGAGQPKPSAGSYFSLVRGSQAQSQAFRNPSAKATGSKGSILSAPRANASVMPMAAMAGVAQQVGSGTHSTAPSPSPSGPLCPSPLSLAFSSFRS